MEGQSYGDILGGTIGNNIELDEDKYYEEYMVG